MSKRPPAPWNRELTRCSQVTCPAPTETLAAGNVFVEGEWHRVAYCPRHAAMMPTFAPDPVPGKSMCHCDATFEMHPWHPEYRCPKDSPAPDPRTQQIGAQVQCYCPRNPKGHLHRPDRGCPDLGKHGQPSVPEHELMHQTLQQQKDDRLLADLFRRALKGDLVQVATSFQPRWAVQLQAGRQKTVGYVVNSIDLTDDEIDALRRSV
jgi:hypothetical protein